MRLGFNWVIPHTSPQEWADKLHKLGCRASVFPGNYNQPDHILDAYVKAAADYDICLAEVGVWNSPVADDEKRALASREHARRQLELADYVKARCCVNVSGGTGEHWFMAYPGNYLQSTFQKNVEVIQYLLDTVKPQHTYYALEMMQWMIPDSPKQYQDMIRAVDRERFAVHVDVANLARDPYCYTHHNDVIDRTFELLGERVRSCHLKDIMLETGVTVAIREVLCGEGMIDHVHYGRKINELDEDLPLLIEHLETEEEYIHSLRYIQQLYQREGLIM